MEELPRSIVTFVPNDTKEGDTMRSATVFNFLIEATLMGSVMILLMLVVRKFLRPQLGSRLIRFAWVLVAVRLLVPLALPNPMMNDIRPTLSDNVGVRPIADQVRVRSMDAMHDVAWALGSSVRAGEGSSVGNAISRFTSETSYGHTGRWVLLAYFIVAALVLGWIAFKNVRFLRRLKRDRVGPLAGEELTRYRLLCAERKIKEVPVYWVDPLPSACLVGILHPYIALPLTLDRKELRSVLTHELCHKKAGDHWFNLVRILCCAVHWFNPLVWLAAHLSRTDQEMACDERVTAPMNDEERIGYANTLALAAARKSAPDMAVLATGMTMKGRHIKQRICAIVDGRKIVAWLCVAALCVACAGTLFSFATAEYVAPLTMPSVQPMTGEALNVRSIADTAEAAAYGVEMLGKAFELDTSAIETTVQRWGAGQWTVSVLTNKEQAEEKQYYARFDDDGVIWQLMDTADEVFSSGPRIAANPTYKTNETYSAPFFDYVRSFAALLMPYQPLDGMFIDIDYWCLDRRFLEIRYAENYSDRGCYFYLQIEPEVRLWGFERWDTEIQEARLQEENQEQEALAQTLEEVSQTHDADFQPLSKLVQGTAAYEQAARGSSYLTEVYGYMQADADRFVYAIETREDGTYCLYHDPDFPSWNYIHRTDEITYARSPYTSQQGSYNGEGGFRYFWYAVEENGWLQSWTESDRDAFVNTALDTLYNLPFDEAQQASLKGGALTPAQAVELAFEVYYGAPDQWSEALTAWRDSTLLRFGLATQAFAI